MAEAGTAMSKTALVGAQLAALCSEETTLVHAELRAERAREVQVIDARNLEPCLPVGWQVSVMNNPPPKNNDRLRRRACQTFRGTAAAVL